MSRNKYNKSGGSLSKISKINLFLEGRKIYRRPLKAGEHNDKIAIKITKEELIENYLKLKIKAFLSVIMIIGGLSTFILMIVFDYEDPSIITEAVSGLMGAVIAYWTT
jgi:hypothetical protein